MNVKIVPVVNASIYKNKDSAEIIFLEMTSESYIELDYVIPFQTDGEEYIFLPSCCYDGNRFDVLKKEYPPLFTAKEAKVDMPVTITDVPRLNKDGSGIIEVTTGDVSVPCVGVYSKTENRGILVFTIQQIDGINLGLAYEKGSIKMTYPHMRKSEMYRWPHMVKSIDQGIPFHKDKNIKIPYKIMEFSCSSLEEFYHIFFENRKCMGMDDSIPTVLEPKKQFEIQKEKMNQLNWKPKGEFYGVETEPEGNMSWQPGWIGGGMYTYALMKLGGELEWERGMKTLEHLFRGQTEQGFFYESGDEEGNFETRIFGYESAENWHMIRKSGDVLYYVMKHFSLMKEKGVNVPVNFQKGAKKLADAFVKLWNQYNQFGQFVNLVTGELLVGGSVSGGIVPAGLAEAAIYFKEDSYLDIAKESAEYYCQKVMKEGYSTGGPGEILQCPDSESAFALLESIMVLYERTQESKWLAYGRYMAEFGSSWVVAYNYSFPPNSEFHKLDMKTTGCVFANIQNKHAAPGICTFSGYRIYQLYQWTGEEKYLELYHDIIRTVSQYLSTEERPIHSWDVPKDAMLLEGTVPVVEQEVLPPGFICERVNMSDWESQRCVGGVFNASCCWCETANLMILAECEADL